ncbi:MAG: hypothetical protein KDB73_00670 [Planctomycetes bacterium]|nr:hypothetical protein [Planctomycetota bacterium]
MGHPLRRRHAQPSSGKLPVAHAARRRGRAWIVLLALLALVATSARTARPEEPDDPLNMGSSPPNVVRVVEQQLAVGWYESEQKWLRVVGRRALPALLQALAPAPRPGPWKDAERRGRAMKALSVLVRGRDLPLLRALHERGWDETFWLLFLLRDPQLPLHTRRALERGERRGLVELAAFTRPGRVVDEAVLAIVKKGRKAIGVAARWMPIYIDRRRLTTALPDLEAWIAASRGGELASRGGQEQMPVPIHWPPPRNRMQFGQPTYWYEEACTPPGPWRPRALAWFIPFRRDAESDWVEQITDLSVRLDVVCARLGSRQAMNRLHELARRERTPSEPPPATSEPSDVEEHLENLIQPFASGGRDGEEDAVAWWSKHGPVAHFDEASRTWFAE